MRRSLKIITLLCLLAASVLAPSGARSAERQEAKTYYGGSDSAPVCTIDELDSVPGNLNLRRDQRVAGACFDLAGIETDADIVIDDATGLPIGAGYAFENDAGDVIGPLLLFCGSTTTLVPPGSAYLVVYVGGVVVGPAACLLEGEIGSTGTTGTITAKFQLGSGGSGPPIDGERDCIEVAPAAAGISGVTDTGQDVSLSAKVLLDGISLADGEAFFSSAADSYAPLDVTLEVTSFESVSFTGTNAQYLISQAKAHEGWQPPAGTDLVFLLTTKDIEWGGQTAVAGLADCIGGIKYAERSFAVGEIITFEDLEIGPLTFYREATARTIAHEIGHLMGGQHHYANCAEGAPGDGLNGEATPCTLMFNSLDFLGPQFSALNGAVVRGHAVDFASP